MIRFSAEFEEVPLRRGTWSAEEDKKLIAYINKYGIWNWNEMPKAAGLQRTGKSCRLRWMNYLRPGIKRGNFNEEEEKTIRNLHEKMGNCWSTIAAELPGRTDSDIKNYWNTRLSKRLRGEVVQATNAQRTQASKSSSGTVPKKLLPEQENPLPKIFESSGCGSSNELCLPLEPSPVNLSPMGEMKRNCPTMEEKNREEIDLRIPIEDQPFMEDQTCWFEELIYPYTSEDDTSDYWSNVFNQANAFSM